MAAAPADPAEFWAGPWRDALARHGDRAADDADRVGVAPLAIAVDDDVWTLRRGAAGIEVVAGTHAPVTIMLDRDAFADLVTERRTALGLVIGARAFGDPGATDGFCTWDPVLRSVLDGRGVHRAGEVAVRGSDGGPLDLDQRFRLGDPGAAHFLAEAGFLLLADVLDDAEIDALDADLKRAVADARPDDGESWWAATGTGERYPCRILNFERKAPAMPAVFEDPRFLAIGEILDDGHRPGDPFGEHFAQVTAEGLLKRVGSVEGLACLPWHKDCDRGGHAMYCSGLTIGICLTPVDDAHGGLDVMAGSHRANIARDQIDRAGLPSVTLRAKRGDLTVHLSCALHRSTHPTTDERRVIYTGFTLPRADEGAAAAAQSRLEAERAAIGGPSRRGRLSGER
ncbi:MAG: phytanoyl-CoA dioxygenase family protein [Acidimicrobiia bacterium]|nr:phytanoyl-CoA dioxygenase family protein [Acidimicrobiia bacterium]